MIVERLVSGLQWTLQSYVVNKFPTYFPSAHCRFSPNNLTILDAIFPDEITLFV
jgi:hypothetical protein